MPAGGESQALGAMAAIFAVARRGRLTQGG